MSIAYRCDEPSGVTITVAVGAPTAAEWQAVARRQFADPRCRKGSATLVDATDAQLAAASDDDLANIAIVHEATNIRTAPLRRVVVACEPLRLARTFQRTLPALEMPIVFADLEAACSWLGIDNDQARSMIAQLRAEIDDRVLA